MNTFEKFKKEVEKMSKAGNIINGIQYGAFDEVTEWAAGNYLYMLGIELNSIINTLKQTTEKVNKELEKRMTKKS